MEQVKVFAPATVANVGAAFDVLGFAVDQPGDYITAIKSKEPGVRVLSITGDQGRLPKDSDKNTASVAVQAFITQVAPEQGIDLVIEKCMPLGSGLGSSAASAVAGVFAANELLGKPLSTEALLPFAMEGERIACGAAHADNVAPSLLGGFVLIRSYAPLDIVRVPTPSDLYCSLVHPLVEVKTSDARKILRKEILLKDAVTQWGNIAGLVAGLYSSNYELIGRSLQDVIIEPERSLLIPGFYNVKSAALTNGALGCSLSGSGPSMFAFSNNLKTAEKVGEVMSAEFAKLKIASETYVSKVNHVGPKVV